MKYIGMPFAMWLLFEKSFERNLTAVFGISKADAKSTMAKAKEKYKEIIENLPEFEKGDRFQMNIVGCAMCALDYAMSEAGGASHFVRECTFASGDEYCDCGYKKRMG